MPTWLIGGVLMAPTPAGGPVLFEDFSGTALRKASDGTRDLFSVYTGTDPAQSYSLDTTLGRFRVVVDGTRFRGISTGGNTSSTLNDTASADWTGLSWADLGGTQQCAIVSGTGAGQYLPIASSTAHTLTLSGSWTTIPDATSHYVVTYSNAIYAVVYPGGHSASQDYLFPAGYAQKFIKTGTWAPAANRLTFWFKVDKTVPRRADGGGVVEIGTYIRQHADPAASNQGQHYYHITDPNFYAGRWAYCVMSAKPQHQRAADPNIEWPVDPENTTGLLMVSATLTGTLGVTNGSAAVTGSGTSFSAQVSPGQWLHFAGDGAAVAYKVRSVSSATSITLGSTNAAPDVNQSYLGTTRSGIQAQLAYPLPSPKPPGTTSASDPGDLVTVSSYQQPLAYYDGLTDWYFDLVDPNIGSAGGFVDSTWQFDDFYLSSVTVEPDDLVSSLICVYTGSAYEITWAGPKGLVQLYTVYYGSSPLQSPDGSYNGAGTSGGTVSSPGGYTGTIWTSPAMAQAATIYFFILPQGRSNGTQVRMAQRAP